VKDKTIIGAVIVYNGELLTIVADKDSRTGLPATIRQIGAKQQDETIVIPSSEFAKEKSERFFGEQK
jgi:hypothetical protein